MQNGQYFVFSWLAVVFLSGSAISSASLAQIETAPPPFAIKDQTAKGVFIDLQTAVYDMTFDVSSRETRVKAVMDFKLIQAGFPVLDFYGKPEQLYLDGVVAEWKNIAADPAEKPLLVVMSNSAPGDHRVEIVFKSTGEFAPTYTKSTVSSGFFMSDLEAIYLQSYLPSNFEYDRYKMKINVEIHGTHDDEVIYTNGQVKVLDRSHWQIEYPEYFNCSAIYFHLIPKNEVDELNYEFTNSVGQKIPATVYGLKTSKVNLAEFKEESVKSIKSFETAFGPWPHPKLVIYAQAESGGMEYSGATLSNMWALNHELAHSYFARGVMPANGNAGWIDEAMATFIDDLPRRDPSIIKKTNMSNHSPYYTGNDGEGYTQGAGLLAYFDKKLSAADKTHSMFGFLRVWFQKHNRTTTVIQDLYQDLEQYYGHSLKDDFNYYVFGLDVPKPKYDSLLSKNRFLNNTFSNTLSHRINRATFSQVDGHSMHLTEEVFKRLQH